MGSMSPLILLAAISFIFVFWLVLKAHQNLFDIACLLFFFLPFEWIPTVEFSGFTLKINHLVGIILIFFWIFRVIKTKKIIQNPYLPFYLCLIGALLLSIPGALLAGKALISSALVVFSIFLAIIIYDLVRTRADLEKINRYIYYSAWMVVIFSIWQFLGNFAGLPNYLTGLREGYTQATF